MLEEVYSGQVVPKDTGYRFLDDLNEYLKSIVGTPNGRTVGGYSPSGLSGCGRKMWYQRTGVTGLHMKNPDTTLNLDIGTAVHGLLNKYAKRMYGALEYRTDVPIKIPWMHIGGEADLLLLSLDKDGRARHVGDFKTISRDGFSKISMPRIAPDGTITPKSMTGYVWQLHAYMVGLDCANASLIYFCKENGLRQEFPVLFSTAVWDQICEKIHRIEQCVEKNEPPPYEPSFYCRECDYVKTCNPPK